ncbi:MAG TPA: dihydrodipicolinate reductase [Candidatus Eisenbacteria bacterium]|nr:dihydrodipicolinate reductase [Candidatus Eisenbacteria bacterium]
MAYRVIQWATGNVGRAAVEGILAHPDLTLVGAFVTNPAKAGRDVGEICGLPKVGVAATNDVDEVLATRADCVLYAPLLAQTDEVVRLLRSGKNVVTPVGWFYPERGPGTAEIEEACRAGGVSLHGTGMHPGGFTERFPLTFSAMCMNVRHVRAEEFSDLRNYQAEFVVREIMLFGKTPQAARESPMLQLLAQGFHQSIDMVATGLGVTLDTEKRDAHEMAVATRDLDTPVGRIAAGTIAAQRFTWQGTVRGEPAVTARVNWFMGDGHLDPDWRLGEERFEVALDADPPIAATFHGIHPPEVGKNLHRLPGMVGTAMHCVNAIPYVCEAAPGIRTYLDLPLVCGRRG